MRAHCAFGQRQAQASWPGQQLQLTGQLISLTGLQLAPRSASRRSHCTAATISATVMAPSALKTYKASEMSEQDLLAATARPRIDFASILSTVSCMHPRRQHAAPRLLHS